MNPGKITVYDAVVLAVALGAAVLLGALVLTVLGVDPGATYLALVIQPLSDSFGWTEVLVRAIPLTLVALGIAVAFRSGIFNIGAEGQILMGVLAATATALALPDWPKPLLLPLVLTAGAAGGALWGALAGWLKARLGVNEILSTVMLNYIGAQLFGWLLRGPMIDPDELVMGSGTPQSVRLPVGAWLDRLIPGTRLHWGLVVAVAAAVVVWLLLWKTTAGYRLRAAGTAPKAARYAGISVGGTLVSAMVVSGALAGLAGAVEVAGVHHRAIEGISSGYGFSGIVVALFGFLHPVGILPAAFLFSVLIVGTEMTQRSLGVPAQMVLVLQGAVILALVSAQAFWSDAYARQRFGRWWDGLWGRKGNA
jgi:ABC-type uncharacterized transport system permease subunit